MEPASVTPSKRERKTNFSDTEMHILLDKYAASGALLMGKFCSTITHKRKNAIWVEIAQAVSACGFALRSSLDVRNKWSDIKRGCIKVAADMKRPKTGGGPAVPPPWYFDTVMDIVGDGSALVSGIDGE